MVLAPVLHIGCVGDGNGPSAPHLLIEVRYLNSPPPALRAAVDSAALVWNRALRDDLPAVPVNLTDACGTPGLDIHEDVPGLLILVSDGTIDGPGGYIAVHASCADRDGDPVTASLVSRIHFDADNLAEVEASHRLYDVALHEFGHALGFSLHGLSVRGCLQDSTSSVGDSLLVRDTHYSCARGLAVFDSLGGAAYTAGQKVPLENCATPHDPPCTLSRANTHWRESVFVDEVMSTYVNADAPSVLSAVTLAVLEDLGHEVNYGAAQRWVLPTFPVHQRRVFDLGSDADWIVRSPPVLNRLGRVVEVPGAGARSEGAAPPEWFRRLAVRSN